jgi:broad-specificity NMP kinase
VFNHNFTMVAVEEARSLLDALMGGDRNAVLPKGSAIPGNKRSIDGELLLPGKKSRSCFDPDICPLYTTWGRDVYELFVNTKSDLGPNPYVVDVGAHQEYLKLPREEKERLGFDYFLFQKLNELVRQCDRVVQRNNEKLRQELVRKGIQRSDVPEHVDDEALEHVARKMVQVEDLQQQVQTKVAALEKMVLDEDESKKKLEPLLLEKRSTEEKGGDMENSEALAELAEIQRTLGSLTLEKGRLLFDIGQLINRITPLQDDVVYHRRQLDYVKSDVSTDKTVCEVSGNFMSARDADERIAAHYSGKQYVGWKLVRDKLAEMQKIYGRYGPPPPRRRDTGPPPMAMGGGRGWGDRAGGRGGGGGGGFRGPPQGRFDDRGFRGGPPAGGGRRW